jgi:IclR family transcriptional regulator, pca regulon regulatory protein
MAIFYSFEHRRRLVRPPADVNTVATKRISKAKDRDLISSLERGFRVLRVFDQQSVELTPSEVARKTGLPRAATRRVLLTLCSLGYAVTDGKHFRLTPKVLDLAHGYLAKTRVRHLIDPILRDTVNMINDSVALAIRDGGDSITIGVWNSSSFGAVNVNLGLRVPLYVSTPGRVLLGSLPPEELSAYFNSITPQRFTNRTVTSKRALRERIVKIREEGYAVGREEFEPGVYALAVPLKTSTDHPMAALTVVGNAAKIQAPDAINQRLAILVKAAERVRQMLPETLDLTQELLP